MADQEGRRTSGRSRRDGGGRPPRRGGGGRRGGRRFGRRGKVCRFCLENAQVVDYKDINKLRQYISPSGRMLSRRKTGNCAKHQRMLSRAIKRARQVALLPYTAEHVRRYG